MAVVTILLAYLWQVGALPWISGVSEVLGLAAVLLAPGLATEPALKARGWTEVERFGLAAALSLACAALAGVGLQLSSLPVSTGNVLLVLLASAVVLGLASLPQQRRPRRSRAGAHMQADVAFGVGSLVFLALACTFIVIARLGPVAPPLEVAIVDAAGQLTVQPILARGRRSLDLGIALRSRAKDAPTVAVTVAGDGLQTWTADGIHPTDGWTVVRAEVVPLQAGTLHPAVYVTGDGIDLRLPLEIEVTP